MQIRYSLLTLAAGLSLLLSACPSGQSESTGSESPAATESAAAAPATGDVHPAGEPVRAGDLAVIVHGARRAESIDELGDPSRKATAAAGETFLIVALEVGNTGQKEASFSLLSAQPKVSDGAGNAADMDFLSAAALSKAFPEGAIPPGASLRGEVPFKIKADAKDLKLTLSPSLDSGNISFKLD